MKKCPFCSEQIQDGAKKCRFCGEFLNEEKKNKNTSKLNPKKTGEKVPPMKAAEYNMKMAFVLSLITAGITFIFGLVNLGNEGAGYYFFDVVLFAIFAYGIYKKSLVATICAFGYFIMGKISQLVAGESVGAISVRGILFAIGYFKGMQGAISYRKLMNINNFNPREIVLGILTAIVFILVFVGLASGV